jgi:hypothetical protein
MGASRITRRRLLGGLSVAMLLGGSAVALVRTRGYAVPAGRTLACLSAWQFVVVQHAARRIAAPDGAGSPTPDELDVAAFVDAQLAGMHARVRRDLGRLLAYLEHLAPVAAGFASRFTRLPPSDQDHVLASLEQSSQDLLRAGFSGLKALVFMGYYRDARTWPAIGYDGPLIARGAP